MEDQQQERLKTCVNASLTHLFHRKQHIAPTDRYYLMCEFMEWIVNEWDEIEVDWLEEIKI